eukprot:PhF_6_TR20522/c0_g1_i2/m.29602/K06927/DPH6; diphthine-ammonia ligase
MKVVALVSGGKDSTLGMIKCVQLGHEIVCLANLRPQRGEGEIDSYCFQSVGQDCVDLYSRCMGVPVYVKEIVRGTSVEVGMRYKHTSGDEVEVLYDLLREVCQRHPEVEAVCSGAILSDYQRLRVENVCTRLKLTSLGYLWHYPADVELHHVLQSGILCRIVKVSSMGLHPKKFLGRI